MKKFISILLVIIILATLTGCTSSFRTGKLSNMIQSEDAAINDVFEVILEAIKTKDSDLLKSVFSEIALEEAKNIDEGIEYTFDFVKGDIIECNVYPSSSETSNSFGRKKITLYIRIELKTTEEIYYLYAYYIWRNDYNSDYEGIYNLSVITLDNRNSDSEKRYINQKRLYPGVYNPSWMDLPERKTGDNYFVPVAPEE